MPPLDWPVGHFLDWLLMCMVKLSVGSATPGYAGDLGCCRQAGWTRHEQVMIKLVSSIPSWLLLQLLPLGYYLEFLPQLKTNIRICPKIEKLHDISSHLQVLLVWTCCGPWMLNLNCPLKPKKDCLLIVISTCGGKQALNWAPWLSFLLSLTPNFPYKALTRFFVKIIPLSH